MNVRDCMCLSAARRTVRENGGIVSIQYAVKQRLRSRLIYIALCCGLVEDAVECEGLILYSLSLRQEAFGEPVYWVVFWGVEYSTVLSVSARVATGGLSHIQTLLVYDFDDRTDPLRVQLGCRQRC